MADGSDEGVGRMPFFVDAVCDPDKLHPTRRAQYCT